MSTSRGFSIGAFKAVCNCFLQLRLGSRVLVGATAVFIGASCMQVEVAPLFIPHYLLAARNKPVTTSIGSWV